MKIKSLPYATFVLCVVVFSSVPAVAQKVDPADVISKHRASIGTAAALSAINNQLVLSDAQFVLKGSATVLGGRAIVVSTRDKNLWGMNFSSNEYSQDRFGFDGKSSKVGKINPSARSLIGDFLYNNGEILREGLFGGTLSATWPLLHSDTRKAKIQFEGTKTIDGKKALVLSYGPKGGSDLDIKLYFDIDTHRHVRTEYTSVRAAPQSVGLDVSAGQSGSVLKVVEEFSDFTKMKDLMLPKTYRITYSRTGTIATGFAQPANRDAEWKFTVTDIGFNRELDERSFDIDAK